MLKRLIILIAVALVSISFAACDDDTTNLCGNGKIDEGEQCDPAMDTMTGICSDTCKYLQFCGNGIVEPGEECDDGNFINTDSCSVSCNVLKGCGNGSIDVTVDATTGHLIIEECDDDNVRDGDGCSSDCKLEGTSACGNGILEYPEECDDGNTEDGDGCDSTCNVESGCGDNEVNIHMEQCDDGNTLSGDGCSSNCMLEFVCGDGQCDTELGEACEFCPSDCCPDCGNGLLDEGEECDDGNTIRFDGCSPGCNDEDGTPTCGNGIWEAGEECDDGNTESGDGCDSQCKREFIVGDGICEDLKGETCKLSPADCCPDCGNGILDPGEECDGNSLNNTSCTDLCYDGGVLGCTEWCSFSTDQCTGTGPVCGDGTAECSEECDTDDFKGKTCQSFGFSEGSLACNGCTIDLSGCSGFLYYLASDFDSGSPSGWIFNGTWSLGTPVDGPGAANSGSNCIGVNLTDEYDSSLDYDTSNVTLPSIDLSVANAPTMTFMSWMYTESASYDGGRIEVSIDGGQTWEAVDNSAIDPPYDSTTNERWGGIHDSWTQYTVDLSAYIGHIIKIRFAFHSDSSVQHDGWYIDDVIVTEPTN